MSRKRKILIIGAGASGLAAAIAASGKGASVTVLEHNEEPGRKLLLTAKGRCNISNTDISPSHYPLSDSTFLEPILRKFSFEDSEKFFASIGIRFRIKYYPYNACGYAYPLQGGAYGVRDCLYRQALFLGAGFHFSVSAENLSDPFSNEYGDFDRLILATGSNAHPETGSDSSIYPLLKRMGLDMKPFLPALVPLCSKDELLSVLSRQRRRSVAQLFADGEPLYSEYGEIQFQKYSISGIPVLNMSGRAVMALREGRKVSLLIDGHEFPIHRPAGFKLAQTSLGGLDTGLFSSETLSLKSDRRIHAAGEILGAAGDCGGFNLHFAFASGLLAGLCAATD